MTTGLAYAGVQELASAFLFFFYKKQKNYSCLFSGMAETGYVKRGAMYKDRKNRIPHRTVLALLYAYGSNTRWRGVGETSRAPRLRSSPFVQESEYTTLIAHASAMKGWMVSLKQCVASAKKTEPS